MEDNKKGEGGGKGEKQPSEPNQQGNETTTQTNDTKRSKRSKRSNESQAAEQKQGKRTNRRPPTEAEQKGEFQSTLGQKSLAPSRIGAFPLTQTGSRYEPTASTASLRPTASALRGEMGVSKNAVW